jgi:hypothetical protein
MHQKSRIVKCREAIEIFGDHVEGRLRPLQRWRLRIHLWMCRNCRNYLFSYITAVRTVKTAHHETPKSPVADRPAALMKLIVSAAKQAGGGDRSRHESGEDSCER